MASIICSKCGAEDDDAVDMDWTLGYKRGVIVNATCEQCGGELLSPFHMPDVLFIVDEYDGEMWWAVRENLAK